MRNFELRRDRFEFFESFENPLLNICYELEVKDFRPYCKSQQLAPFHFFLYCLFRSFDQLDNFKYRLFEKQVIKVDKLIGSYTVIDENNIFNFTRFDNSPDMRTFIKNSLESKVLAENSQQLINTGVELSSRQIKDYIFITSIPWLKFTSIEHPVFKFKSADIPSVAWGKFSAVNEGKLLIPFSVQAHHGFVDAYHVHLLGQTLAKTIEELI